MEAYTVYEMITSIAYDIDDIIYEFESQRYFNGNKLIEDLVEKLKNFGQYGLSVAPELADDYAKSIKKMTLVYKDKNYVGVCDCLRNDLKPMLYRAVEILHRKGIYSELRKKEMADYCNGNVYGKLSEDKVELLDKIKYVEPSDDYILSETPIGLYTLSINRNRKIQLHSEYEPYMEAIHIADNIYHSIEHVEKYGLKNIIVIGLGLGYHVQKLAQYNDIGDVTVIEIDINVLAITLKYVGLPCFREKRIHIIYDPQLVQFGKILEKENTNVYIYQPAIENITDVKAKEAINNYFLSVTARHSHLPELIRNFNQNILLQDRNIYDIKEEFADKDIIIVAGGPSLDEHMDSLKKISVKRREKIKILAVGTVYRKLYNAGIIPDYVIITDSQLVVCNQIKGLDTEKSCLLYMSTVDNSVPLLWKGRRYIIFQRDFIYAERYVNDNINSIKSNMCDFFVSTGASVTTTAFDIALRYHAHVIITLGMDFAYYNNLTHSEGTLARQETDEQWYDMYVKSNEGMMIPTCRNLNGYRLWIENRISARTDEEKKTRLINCSKGAVIAGMEYKDGNQFASEFLK